VWHRRIWIISLLFFLVKAYWREDLFDARQNDSNPAMCTLDWTVQYPLFSCLILSDLIVQNRVLLLIRLPLLIHIRSLWISSSLWC
jgi:hypothetical protein